MIKIILIFYLLFASILLFAQEQQNDLVFTVKKKKALTIEPDNMYLQAGSPSQYTIKGIPAGYSVRSSFNGARLRINADGTFTLQPENKSGNRPYLADLQISIYNSEGDAMILKRKYFVNPKPVNSPLTSQQSHLLPDTLFNVGGLANQVGSSLWRRLRAK